MLGIHLLSLAFLGSSLVHLAVAYNLTSLSGQLVTKSYDSIDLKVNNTMQIRF